jgi:hypothetical protein
MAGNEGESSVRRRLAERVGAFRPEVRKVGARRVACLIALGASVAHANAPFEQASVESLLRAMRVQRGDTPPPPPAQLAGDARASDASMLSALSRRLREAEAELESARCEAERLVQENAALRARLTDEGADAAMEISRLRSQLTEMEAFLADYGLKWVGAGASSPNPASGEPGDDSQPPDPEALRRAVSDLNALVGDGALQVQRDQRGARFAPRPRLEIVLYREGLTVDGGALRRYASPEARSFLSDMLDGYFPSELRDRFPDGVPLALRDERGASFETARARDGLTAAELLRACPERAVTTAGAVVEVRAGVRALLQQQQQQQQPLTVARVPAAGPGEVAVRARDHPRLPATLVLSRSACVGELRGAVARTLGSAPPSFRLASLYPRRELPDDAESLVAAGLERGGSIAVEFIARLVVGAHS